jgi:hypothetical protein
MPLLHDDWVYWVSHHLAASQSALELHWPGHTRTVQPATALYLIPLSRVQPRLEWFFLGDTGSGLQVSPCRHL